MIEFKPSSHKRSRAALGLALAAVMAFSALAASASAAVIVPAGSTFEMNSNKVEFSFGSTAITCSSGGATGTTSALPSSEAKLANPIFKSCLASNMEGTKSFNVVIHSSASNPFILKANSLTEGALRLPGLMEQGLEFSSGLCILKAKPDTPAGVWTNGKEGVPVATPATLAFSSERIYLRQLSTQSEKNCPATLIGDLKKGLALNLTATFSVADTQTPSAAVRFK